MKSITTNSGRCFFFTLSLLLLIYRVFFVRIESGHLSLVAKICSVSKMVYNILTTLKNYYKKFSFVFYVHECFIELI